MKLTLANVRSSRFAEAIGACYTDLPRIAAAVNEAVQRLIMDPRQPDTGWFGTWVPMVFNVTRSNPYITAPRGVARLMLMDVCKTPIKLQNQFYEYLWSGVGILPKSCPSIPSIDTQGLQRGYYPTLVDVPSTGLSYIRAYPTDPLDVGKRILVQAYDNNGMKIYGLDGLQQIEGFYLTLDYPFVDSLELIGPLGIYGIQKDYTNGDVPLFAVDESTGIQTALARYEPGETAPMYPRYYLDSLPQYCCTNSSTLQVNAMAKRDYYPVAVDSDWILIGNLPALIAEGQSIYHDNIQDESSAKLSLKKHNDAVLLLQGELDHYLGKETPAVNVSLFGTAKPRYQAIGLMR